MTSHTPQHVFQSCLGGSLGQRRVCCAHRCSAGCCKPEYQVFACHQGCKWQLMPGKDLSKIQCICQLPPAGGESIQVPRGELCCHRSDALPLEFLRDWRTLTTLPVTSLMTGKKDQVPRTWFAKAFHACFCGLVKIETWLHLARARRRQERKEQAGVEDSLSKTPNV